MHYQIQISLNSKFTKLVVNKVVESVTEYEVKKDLDYYTVYWWRVKTINPMTGQESAWSTPCQFRIKAQDIIIGHNVDDIDIIYGSEYFGLKHKFVTDYEKECTIPDADLDVCFPTSGDAMIGVVCSGDELVNYCTGVYVPLWEDVIVYLLTEDEQYITTEDGERIVLYRIINT